FRTLRARVIKIQGERDYLALLHQTRRRDDVLRRGVVECANLVIWPPLAPVLVLLGGFAHVVAGDLSGRHLISSEESGTTLAAGIQPVSAGDASPTGNVAAQCYDENKGRKRCTGCFAFRRWARYWSAPCWQISAPARGTPPVIPHAR